MEDLDKLLELSKQDFKCPNEMCKHYEEYNQCYNHSHVLCPSFLEYYEEKKLRAIRCHDGDYS